MTHIPQHTHVYFCPPGLQRAGPRQRPGTQKEWNYGDWGYSIPTIPLFPQGAESQGNEGTEKHKLSISLLSKSESQSGPQ